MKPPRIELICVGSELLSHRVNTHTVTLGQRFKQAGFEIVLEHTVGDDPKLMADVFKEIFKRADVIITSGGLGPTFDDVTRNVWSKVLKRPLTFHPALVSSIKRKFQRRGIKMPIQNRRQGFLLKNAIMIPNDVGTAPGQFLTVGKKHLVLLPGPKKELSGMINTFLLPRLSIIYPQNHFVDKAFYLFGRTESEIEWVRPVVRRFKKLEGCSITHGILASQAVITVKFQVQGKNKDRVEKVAAAVRKAYLQKIGPALFSETEADLKNVVAELLKKHRLSVSVAESCTGGLLSKQLTDTPGSSEYFKDGVVTYSNQSKTTHLGVKPQIIKKYGAVSPQVARQMAEGLRRKSKSDYSLSITGIAGPNGGSAEKPVGLVYIGLAGPKVTRVSKFQFHGDRGFIRLRAVLMALELLRKQIVKST